VLGDRSAGAAERSFWPGRAVLLLLVLLLFREALAGGVFYKRDIHLIWHPEVEGFVRAIAGGSLPLWDPSPAFGQPLLADPASQALYPPTWLNLVMRPWVYYTVFALGHVLFSALAFHALARRWGLSDLAATTGAAVWALSGPFLSLVDLWHHFASASYLPAVLLAGEQAVECRRVRDVLVLGLILGLQILGGSADYCALTLATLAAWIALVRVDWRQPRAVLGLAAGGFAALLVAVALSAGLWVGALDAVARSARSELPDAMRTYWSMHPASLAETLLAGLPTRLPLTPGASAALFEGREPFLASLYLGLPALVLVAAAFAGVSGRRCWALAAIGIFAVLVALGRHAPVYGLVTTLVPPLRVLRYPVKAMPVAAFAWSGLAAFGVEAWAVGRGRERWRYRVFVPAAAASALAGALAASVLVDAAWLRPLTASLLAVNSREAVQGLARGLVLHAGLAAIVAALALLHSGRASRTAWAAAAAAIVDLALAHPRPNPVAPPALYAHRPEALASLGDVSRVRLYSYDYGEAGRTLRWLGDPGALALARLPAGWTAAAAEPLGMQLALAPQTPGRWGIRQAFDVDYRGLQPAPLAWFTRAVRVVEERPDDVLKLLQIGAVTHVTAFHAVAGDRLRRVAEVPGLYARPLQVFEVPGTLPRARVVSGVRVALGPEALAVLLDPSFDPARSVLLAQGQDRAATPGFAGRAAVTAEASDRLRIEVELGGDGHLVVADTYDPGWRVRVDGREAVLLRADSCFRAVALPAGRHTVEMAYRPPVVLAGLLASAIALVGVVASILTSRERRAGSPGAAARGPG
jgi:hypothetical protein